MEDGCGQSEELEPLVWEQEYVGEPLDGVKVQGRLKTRKQFWRATLRASAWVTTIVSQGYSLPLLVVPPPIYRMNHQSALSEPDFVEEEIAKLVRGTCVVNCAECPWICNPLLVVANAQGKKRLVVDLRYVNQFLRVDKFKYEGLELVPVLFSQGEWFITFDLKSGYHHVDINENSWKYLGFSWGVGIHRKFYQFRVLPFGLATAC